MRSGHGREINGDDSIYTGEFARDMRNGSGKQAAPAPNQPSPTPSCRRPSRGLSMRRLAQAGLAERALVRRAVGRRASGATAQLDPNLQLPPPLSY